MFNFIHSFSLFLNGSIFPSSLMSKGSRLYILLARHLKLECVRDRPAAKLESILIVSLAANLVLQESVAPTSPAGTWLLCQHGLVHHDQTVMD